MCVVVVCLFELVDFLLIFFLFEVVERSDKIQIERERERLSERHRPIVRFENEVFPVKQFFLNLNL